MNQYIDDTLCFLSENKESLSLIVAIFVGTATIITSFVTILIMRRQNEICKDQIQIQKIQNQPIFDICIYQQKDTHDGKYGDDILEIRNIGSKMTSCSASVNVFFTLSYNNFRRKDTVCAEVIDYFLFSNHNNLDNGVVERFWSRSNNRIFNQGYHNAIKDSNDGIYYFYDKIILVKIEYKDIYKESHVVYFNRNYEIGEREYSKYFELSKQTFKQRSFKLHDISYEELKAILDKKINCSK